MSDADYVDDVLAAWRRELPEIAGVELEVAKRASRLAALLEDAAGPQLAALGITAAEFDVLAALRRAEPPHRLRPSELTATLMRSSGGTSNALRRLEADGLVTREPDPDDRRGSWVQLTADGVRTSEEAVRAAGRAQGALLRRLPDADLRAAADALRTVLLELGDRARPAPSRRVGRRARSTA
jgi:DNA-binding MarR family transcriptional regulator